MDLNDSKVDIADLIKRDFCGQPNYMHLFEDFISQTFDSVTLPEAFSLSNFAFQLIRLKSQEP